MKKMLSAIAFVLMKSAILLALAFVWLLYHVLMICCVTVRYIALPMMFVAAVIALTTYSDDGLTRDVVECIITFAGAAAFYFALPQLPKVLSFLVVYFADLLKAPMPVKSTVKYIF